VRIIIGISIGLLIFWILGQMIAFAVGILWARRRSRYALERRLRRRDLPEDVIEEIVVRYHAPGLIRDLIRSARS